MFQFHSQIAYILNEIENIGEIRLIKIDFGFPFKGAQDFRYNKALGGGALLDCGGYTIKLAGVFLGESARIVYSDLHGKEGFEVDIYGNAVIVNDAGRVVYLAFGMDNSYKCSLEIWGSNGTLYTNRVFTAPDGFIPIVEETDAAGNHKTEISLAADDSFRKSIEYFYGCINDTNKRLNAYKDITKQAGLVEEVGKCFK
jgi:predicted dehydrogenase